ncbi:autophagy-related protein 23-like [Impatiens glandulifera]|uniref:autophagy-related protein 23-like n=1 Tax=Impatiens glandulifera TaxID=253017 RepID=UPI001FB18442|nr:autophagy-related protein 23-like [Impatiens glandulifera]
MVIKMNGRVHAYAMQIGKIMRFLQVELGEGEPLALGNILNSEHMSKRTAKTARPKSSRTKSSKEATSVAPAGESSKQADLKGKAIQTEVLQKRGRPIPLNTVRPNEADSPSSRQAEPSGSQETHSKSKENPTAEVIAQSENSKSPTKNIDDIIDDVGLRTLEVIEDVVQTVIHETEDDVTSLLQQSDQVEVIGQPEIHPVEETANLENITPPAQEGNNKEKEPSGSVGDKSIPTESTLQLAQDGPTNPPITPEGPSQVNKGKEVMIEDSLVQGDNETKPGQTEIVPEAEVSISAEEEAEMFQNFIRDMNKEAEELATPYHLWEKLVALEEEALKVTGTYVIQAAYPKTLVMEEYAKLQAVNYAMKKVEGVELTPMELKMFERFQTVRNDLARNVDRLEAEWREECKNLVLHADQFQSKPIFNTGESSKTVENRSRVPPIATNAKIATVQTNLIEIVRASIHSEIVETVQTSIKTMIDESVKTATAPLLEMMQAMTAQIEELSKLQADRTQEQICADAETTQRIQDEEDARERLRKETEDKDHELAKKFNEEEKGDQPESTSVQASHSMKTRNKNKRNKIVSLLHQVEQSEEEEDAARLNPRKKKAVETSTASPSSGPTVAQSSRPPRPVGGAFRFNQRTPGISSVFTGWRIDAERREREWKEKEEEERRKEKENGGSSNL